MKLPDPALLNVAARFSAQRVVQTREAMPGIRARNSAARGALVGRHAAEIEINLVGNIRRFTPRERHDRSAVIIYVHGGGWVNCDTITHGAIMADLAAMTRFEVLGPEYPLAPEHPYPAGLDMVIQTIREVAAARPNARIILGGDSAGANLALAAALRLRDEGQGTMLSALLLWYGCYRRKFDTASHKAFGGEEYGLTTEGMRQIWDWYVNDHPDPRYADLDGAEMAGLPPCYLGVAELDCLADDTAWLAGRLLAAHIPHTYDYYPDVNHGFIHFGQFYPPSYEALRGAAHFLAAPGMMR